jgi:hypothetical protein
MVKCLLLKSNNVDTKVHKILANPEELHTWRRRWSDGGGEGNSEVLPTYLSETSELINNLVAFP